MVSKNSRESTPPFTPQRKPHKRLPVKLNPSQTHGVTVVGLGASAGGLKGLKTFFEALPDDTVKAGLDFPIEE